MILSKNDALIKSKMRKGKDITLTKKCGQKFDVNFDRTLDSFGHI